MKKKAITAIAIILLCLLLVTLTFVILNNAANSVRGYNAVGGEMFVFIIPILALFLRDTVRDIKADVKETEEEEKHCRCCVEYEYCTFKAPDGSAVCNEYRKE